MSIFSPTIWVPFLPWLGILYITWDALSTALNATSKLLVGSIYLLLYVLASYWHGHVTETVPEPYLDEIFHIPQAQAYCVGDFHIWDPKLTTPPGLYAFTTLFGNLGGIRSCNVFTLRLFNVLALIATMAYASDCRALITRAFRRQPKSINVASELSPNVLHTALNIALFPPLFFFSGLFYTDVLSTCAVLRMYRLFLQRENGFWLYVAGILALTMRQTNIFWAAVFMGGLEVVGTIKAIEPVPAPESPEPKTWKEAIVTGLKSYGKGDIHDIPLKDAQIFDFVLCAISIVVASVYRPLLIIQSLRPYTTLLVSFAAFVFWNGGVVLGDKSNHIATIHIPQLLYLSAFTAFFSFPLLLPAVTAFLRPILAFLIRSLRQPKTDSFSTLERVVSYGGLLLALFAILAAIRFNTLIHPFTLADNRHYVFYVFRYTILFHPLIRYLLAPIYLLCGWLAHLTLASPSSQTALSRPKPMTTRTQPARKQLVVADEGPSTSWVIVWGVATALGLITAPLVEPRYFIIPWVMWRLHVPSWSAPTPSSTGPLGSRKAKRGGLLDAVIYWAYKDYDYRLWIETAWFLAINAGTGYVFLYKGFEWEQEPGDAMRFMW